MTLHVCTCCGIAKEFAPKNFAAQRHDPSKLEKQCRECVNAKRRARYPGKPRAKPTELPPPPTTEELIQEHREIRDFRDLRAINRQLLADLEKAQKQLSIAHELATNYEPPKIFERPGQHRRQATAVLCCSDWHVEEPVDKAKVNGLNFYDMVEAERRINRLTEGALWLLEMHRTKFEISDFILWLGGDLFSGYIHEELEEQAELSPVECLLWLQPRLTRIIDTLLDQGQIERLIVPCNYGNHGRTTKRKRIATGAENSYEWLLYSWLATHYKDEPRVQIFAPRSTLLYLDVYDLKLRFTHGDAVRYAGGVGGLSIPLNKAIMQWDKACHADLTILGHWHQYMSMEHAVVNGSLIGFTPFAIEIKASFELPAQAFFLIDSRRGKCCSTKIWL